jgi:hypothetical protein
MAEFKCQLETSRALLTALGFAAADKYNTARCQQKLNAIDEIADDEAQAKMKEGTAEFKLMNQLLTAKARGDLIMVINGDDEEEDEPEEKPGKKPGKRGRSAKPSSDEDEDDDSDDDEDEEKPGKKPGKKPSKDKPAPTKRKAGEGVIATIRMCLQGASARNPITKDQILDELKEKFPDKRPDSMKSTINHQVPSYLRKAGHDVQKNDRGYWIGKEEKPEQPRKKKAKVGK